MPLVWLACWFLYTARRSRLWLILIASYVFYGWWDPRFLILIAFSTATDFLIGLRLQRTADIARRRWLLVLSLAVNLGLLFTFKYFNFFASSLVEACASMG